ncbi:MULTISPECIES: hypothetical protein [Bacillaceae]|uniref:hypothetical protein n=1 Tax=Bacillaceae TaxID=186817 RepID=UPI001404A3EA|nr:hypothetical protein [Bacillus sp. CBEL-1]
MWVVTIYSSRNEMRMFEFESEQEARTVFEQEKGYKILSQVLYPSNPSLALTVV